MEWAAIMPGQPDNGNVYMLGEPYFICRDAEPANTLYLPLRLVVLIEGYLSRASLRMFMASLKANFVSKTELSQVKNLRRSSLMQ